MKKTYINLFIKISFTKHPSEKETLLEFSKLYTVL